jgi:eukaryotic-like serine/threonine-protein kinase
MSAMNPCPGDDQLGRLLAEQLTQPDLEAMELHVESCASCQRRLEALLGKPQRKTLGDVTPLDLNQSLLRRLSRSPLDELRTSLGHDAAGAGDSIFFPCPPDATAPLGRLETYHILERIGSGSAGIVFKAYEEDLDRLVAIKVLRPELAITQAAREQFLSEARTAARVKQENIVTIHAVGLMPGSALPYIVMEFIEGESLSALLSRETQLDPRRAAEIVRQAALGLAAAHEHRLVHRDVKPSNLLIEAKSGQVRIADFGLARLVHGDGEAEGQASSRSAIIVGTPAYMSPEQIRSPKTVDGRSDIYSLGAVLYELLTGVPVFLGAPYSILHQVLHENPRLPRARRDSVPRPLQAITMRCLAKAPSERYATASELAVDLDCWLDGRKIQTRPISVYRKIRTWAGRNPDLATAWSVAAVMLIVIVLGAAAFRVRQERMTIELEDHAEEVKAARREAQHLLATQALERGVALCHEGEVGGGMLWFARSLSLAPSDDDALQWSARVQIATWRRQLNSLLTILSHSGSVHLVAFSRDGRSAFTASAGGGLTVWETAKGKRTSPTPLQQEPFPVLAISPDGRRFLTRGDRNEDHIWASTDNAQLGSREHESPVTAGTFAASSRVYWTGTEKGIVQAWNVTSGESVHGTLIHERAVSVIAVSSDAATVFTGSDNVGQLWEAATGKKLGSPMHHHAPVTAGAISPTGKTVLTASKDHRARLWDRTGREVVPSLRHRDKVYAGAFSPDGSLVLTGSKDRTARLWRTATGTPYGSPMLHDGDVYTVAFGPDGKTLLTGSQDTATRIWEIANADGLEPIATSDNKFSVEKICARGRALFTRTKSGTCNLWHWGAGEFLPIPSQCLGGGTACDWSPDRRTLLIANPPRTAWFWDVASGQRLGGALVHGDRIAAVAFSADGRMALTGSADKTARLWEVATGKALCDPLGHKSDVTAVAFSPDGRHFLTGTWDGEVRVWETATRKIVESVKLGGGITAVAFSPDGSRFLAANRGSTCEIRDVATRTLIGTALQQDQPILSAVFSPDGRMVLTGGEDHTARLWETESGRSIGSPLRHARPVRHVGFGMDGAAILTTEDSPDGSNEVARLWKVPRPIEGDAERVMLWAQVITGMTLDAEGMTHCLDAEKWRQLRHQLTELGGPPGGAERAVPWRISRSFAHRSDEGPGKIATALDGDRVEP